MKKHYELRYNPDIESEGSPAVLYLNESLPDFFYCQGRTIEFGSIEEADIYLTAVGFEKGEVKHIPPFSYKGVKYRNVLMWEVTPCS